MAAYNAYAIPTSYYPPPSQQPQSYQHQYPGYYSSSPQPPYIDENNFRSLYTQRLGALTLNSRPIIQDLSMLAQNYPQMAHIVVDSIERQVRTVSAPFKLPLFYLLDSIAKNAFEPYAAAFSPRIVRLFLDTYYAVDQPTQHKMREMMATWRNGSPSQRELFGPDVQSEIERVWGSSVRRLLPIPRSKSLKTSALSIQRQPTASQVQTELDVVLVQKERALQQNPYNEILPRHIQALHELRKMLPTMGTSDLTATLTRLREMARATAQSVPAPPQPMPPVSYPAAAPFPTAPQLPYSYPPPIPPMPLPAHLPAPVVSLPPPALNTQSIISLLSSITSLQTGTVAVNATTSVEISGSTSIEEYEKALLQRKIKLTSDDITKTTQVLPFLYIKDAPQCNECGMRFPAGEDGKTKLRHHLDQHFRQNTKATDNVGRGFSRSWFVGRKDWIADISDHSLNKGKRPAVVLTEKQKAEAAEALRKELESKVIIIPPGEEGKEMRCAICTEPIRVEFLEEDGDGDWVWKNAVRVDNKYWVQIYHATCHHDWSTSSYNKNRLMDNRGSRQGTPEVPSRDGTTPQRLKSDSPRTPPSRLLTVAGTKRKAGTNIETTGSSASPSSKEGTPLLKTAGDEPRIKRRAIQT
ncbi:hypothetical protein FRC17_006623 [Serendipita sp. 399]|nr:hypothetical protein FRC17_006623 [Serendipita sp. 399]